MFPINREEVLATGNQTIDKPVQSIDLTRAELQLTLSKEGLAYQQLLQEAEDVVFNRDNLNEERTALVNLRKVKKKLTDAENPFTERWKAWNEARKSLVDPVSELLTKKEGEYKKIASELALEDQKVEAEKKRKEAILSEIDRFFIDQSQAIANATDPQELIRVEKLIGSHKANSSRYAEYLPLMAEKAQNLTDLIKSQKLALKQLEGYKQAENAAEQAGDDQKVLDSREAQEQIAQKIEETKITVQEKAVNMATNSEVIEVEAILPSAPKPRRSVWEWEIKDIKLTAKKMSDWVKLEINSEKVDEYLKAKKAEGIEGEEFEFAGIRFYLKKSY